jgi:CarD family transcriptional regulator
MFNIGEKIIYAEHGICQIDGICDKTYFGKTRTYYVLHPIANKHQLTISTPVDNKEISMSRLINREEAKELLKIFKQPGIEWIEKLQPRIHAYNNIVKTGNRKDIIKLVHTLLKKKSELEMNDRKFGNYDNELLNMIQNILYNELALAFNTTYEAILKKVNRLIGAVTC